MSSHLEPVEIIDARLVEAPAADVASAADPPARGLDSGERPYLDLLVANFARILNSEVALYYQPDSTGLLRPLISSWDLGRAYGWITPSHEGGLVGRALGTGRAALEPLDHDHGIAVVKAAREVRLTHAVAAPVRLAHRTAGVLVAGFSAPPQDRAVTLWTAESCAATLGLCLHRPGAYDGLFQTDRHDPLTGCLTYIATRQELAREINRSTRASLPLSLCFIDLDGFKRINDRNGHLRGNDVLAEVGRVLRNGVRSCDTVGRFGGDEFIAILPETTEPHARRLAERLRSRIAAAIISSIGERVTASIGVAQWATGTTAEQLLMRADQALLFAKAHTNGTGSSNDHSAYGPLEKLS